MVGAGSPELNEALLLLNRVVHAAVTSIVVTDPSLPDNPIVYHNPAFERVSGYEAGEIDGRNCRFLQGPDTDPQALQEMRDAIRGERDCRVVLRNYRKNGSAFWNELALSPVHDSDGHVTHFVGVQNDVTEREIAQAERDLLLAQQQRIADTLQRALLLTPATTDREGLEVATEYVPAWDEAQFGGDFYDVFGVADHQIALVVGDVTGKGLQAAQHTAEVKYALRVLLREYGGPTPALHRLNNFIVDSQRFGERSGDAFVCVAVAVVDTRTGETQVASAGMEPPLLVRANGEARPVKSGGMFLGALPGSEYPTVSLVLDEGDHLLLVTDGLTEARRPLPNRDFFGYTGLVQSALSALSAHDVQLAAARIVEDAKAFAGGRPNDDVCLLIARRTLPAARGVREQIELPPDDFEFLPRDNNVEAGLLPDGELAQFALELTELGYWELDTATGRTRRSLRHDQIFGYDTLLPSWTYEQFLSQVHPDDRARVDALYGSALASGSDWNFECRIVRADNNQTRFIKARGRHLRDKAGKATRIAGTVADVTEQSERERTQDFLANLTEETRLFSDPLLLVQAVEQAVGQFLGLSRFLYADVDTKAQTVTVYGDYTMPGVESAIGTRPLEPWSWMTGDLAEGRTVVNRDYQSDVRTASDGETRYRQSGVRADVTVPLLRDGHWVAVFSAQMTDMARNWTQSEISLLETVAQRMWLVIESARVRQAESENAARQRRFLSEILTSVTEGKLYLSAASDLPAPLANVLEPVALTPRTLRRLRTEADEAAQKAGFEARRVQDLLTAAGEAAMNAVVHAGGGTGQVFWNDHAVQVWVSDTGGGISDEAIHKATLERGYSSAGTLGHGFWMMLRFADRLYLQTGTEGTVVVLEVHRERPEPVWIRER